MLGAGNDAPRRKLPWPVCRRVRFRRLGLLRSDRAGGMLLDAVSQGRPGTPNIYAESSSPVQGTRRRLTGALRMSLPISAISRR